MWEKVKDFSENLILFDENELSEFRIKSKKLLNSTEMFSTIYLKLKRKIEL